MLITAIDKQSLCNSVPLNKINRSKWKQNMALLLPWIWRYAGLSITITYEMLKEPKYICKSLWDEGSGGNNYTMLLFEKICPKKCVLPILWRIHLAWHDQNWCFLFHNEQPINPCITIGGSYLVVGTHDARQIGWKGKIQRLLRSKWSCESC